MGGLSRAGSSLSVVVREIASRPEGTITVIRPRHSQIELQSGDMTYLAPDTPHAIWNVSDRPVTYVFVFSNAPEPEPTPHEH